MYSVLNCLFCRISVHFGGGLVGVLAVPLFSHEYGVVYNWDTKSAYVRTTNSLIFLLMHVEGKQHRRANACKCNNYIKSDGSFFI